MSTLAAPSTDAVTATLDDLTDSLQTDPSLDNDFYRAWMGGPLDPAKVRIFAEQYMARTVNTSVMVALSVVYTQDLKARVECVKNLYSEYGNGDPAKAHVLLLENFLSDFCSRVGGEPASAAELHAATPLPTTARFSEVQRSLFTSDDQRVVQGALLAQEHLAYSMLVKLYEGVRCYRSSYDSLDEFHEWCEYFYLHIGEAEKEHKAEALISAAAVCQSDEDLAAVTSAFRTFAQITADYWNGIYAEMNRV